MNRKIISFLILTFFVSLQMNAFCQNAIKEGKKVTTDPSATEYNRNALTMILLSYPNGLHAQELQTKFPSIKVPGKFDDNTLSTQVFTVNGDRAGQSADGILSMLNNKKIGNGIIAKWYNRQADGSFNVDEISRRGLYNAKDLDVVTANAKKVGQASLKDSGEKLLANSYVLVMDYSGILTSEENYIKNKTPADKRTSHGWVGNFTGYLFKLNLDESKLATFYNDLWVNKDDDSKTKAERSAKFDETNFPFSFVMSATGYLNAEQVKPGTSAAMFTIQKSDDQLFSELVEKGVEKAEYDLATKLVSFQVKANVFSTNPIASKIGDKEGLAVDDRYFIFENRQKKNGDMIEVRKAVVRVGNKIANNTEIASGNSKEVTNFYQIGGRKVEEGMLLKQKNDKGIGVSVNYCSGEIGGIEIGAEYLLNRLYRGFFRPSFKLIAELGLDTKYYYGKGDIGFMRYSAGIGKSYYFARNFQLEPSFSFGQEKTSEGATTNSDGSINTWSAYYLKPGLKFGANIRYNFQLIVGVSYYSFLKGVTETNDSGRGKDLKWTDLYPGREGVTLNIGLRIQF
ncbi:MAG TPA: hypothetical protein VIK10_05520 [Prolixibacteraceae bacterium]